MTKKVTIKEFVEAFNAGEPDASKHIDYVVGASFIKVLVAVGAAKEVGKQPNPPGTRGKPSSIFEVENEVNLFIFEDEENKTENSESVVAPVDSVVEPVAA